MTIEKELEQMKTQIDGDAIILDNIKKEFSEKLKNGMANDIRTHTIKKNTPIKRKKNWIKLFLCRLMKIL